MGYLSNATVNRLNLHYGIHALASNAGAVFFAVYLLKAGVPVPLVLVSIAAILGGRFLIRPSLLGLGVRFGLRPLVIAGNLLGACQYPLLAAVHGVGFALLSLIAVSSLSDTIYWTCYHAYFASLGDAEHRGQQVGARETLVAGASIVGPLAGGFGLAHFSAWGTFGLVALVQFLSAWPLFGAPNVKVAPDVAWSYRGARQGILMFAADGWMSSSHNFVWPLALFISLGENFTVFGGALALAALVGAVSGLLLGRHIDAGHGSRAVWWACGGQILGFVLCAAGAAHGEWAIAANAVWAMTTCLYTPTLMTSIYNQAKRAPCVLRFHIATEGGWDAGCASGCLCAAALAYVGGRLPEIMLLGMLGVTWAFFLLRRYYKAVGIGLN